jgi:hypothetical protein
MIGRAWLPGGWFRLGKDSPGDQMPNERSSISDAKCDTAIFLDPRPECIKIASCYNL